MKRFEIRLLADELKEYTLSFLPIHEIYFTVSKVSKQFQQICNELLLFEYNKVMIEQFNQPPITTDLFTSSERLKFVKFSLRSHIYQYAIYIVKNSHCCIDDYSHTRPPLSSEFLKQAKDEFDELSSIFNNFHDLPGREIKVIEKPIAEKGFLSKIVSSIFKTPTDESSKVKTSKVEKPSKLQQKYGDVNSHVIGSPKCGKKSFVDCLYNYSTCNQKPVLLAREYVKSILNFSLTPGPFNIESGNITTYLRESSYCILMANPYSSNVLADFERMKMLIKENVELAELIVVTTMKDLEGSQPRFISQEEANWFAYQNFGALHRNITITQLEETFIVSCYCMIMRHLIANFSFDDKKNWKLI